MPSTSKRQAMFMTACAKGWNPDACPPMEVSRKFHEADKKEGKFICKEGCEHRRETTMDAATDVLKRLRLIKELNALRAEKQAASGNGLQLLRIARRMNSIRADLGMSGATPPPPKPQDDERVAMLRAIAGGTYDGEGIDKLLSRIVEAVQELIDADALTEEAETAANAAIDHWAEVDERINGRA